MGEEPPAKGDGAAILDYLQTKAPPVYDPFSGGGSIPLEAQRLIAWLWARTVRSPDPAAKGAMVPLVSSFMLSTKENKKVWVDPVLDDRARDGWKFEIRDGALAADDEAKLKLGTKAGKGQAFTCVLTGSPIERPYIQKEGKAGRLAQTGEPGLRRRPERPRADQSRL